ncbi:MAG: hypothetical protein HOC63_10705 [Rhodospirillales bacterium]|jgi:cysteinyl-tRNA synthetase, unknown class|nr:hypothetical protein [Rhodospirillales bacterium]MBT4041530.1 hypothetical protein [Rhodospirillales bacterium]MBT4627148.1 hypothetical protein [Rhodospirillales bacterium]MBT5351349.1 hypothetical protein [Rhodospirillales bacterium]MBT6110642.1 hypothetical protein [Rhodospirillales bacterium]
MKMKNSLRHAGFALFIGASLLIMPNLVHAQEIPDDDSGVVRIQGEDVNAQEDIDLTPSGPLVDYREEMRRFIQNIARFARGYKREFNVIIEDALELIVKRNVTDETLAMPARTFTRSIQGVMATGLYHGTPQFGEPAGDDKILTANLDLLLKADQAGLAVFVLDETSDRAQIDAGRSQTKGLGYVYGATDHAEFDLSMLPSYPRRPFDENPVSILSLGAIKNFAVIGNANAYGREDEFALQMHETNHDLMIVDVFLGQKPLSKRAVETLKYKKNGARRQVFARVDIGTAASYRYYWKANWREGFPPWLGRTLPDNPDAHYVEYWRPEWQRIITGDTQSYIYGVIDQGYDGVILAGADIYQAFDGSTEEQ